MDTKPILLAEGVEDLEYYVPLMRLQEEGAHVLSAATDDQPVRGKNGLEATPDLVAISPIDASAVLNTVVTACSAPQITIRRTAKRSTAIPVVLPTPR